MDVGGQLHAPEWVSYAHFIESSYEEKILLSLLGIEPQFPCYPVCSLFVIPTELFRFTVDCNILHYLKYFKKFCDFILIKVDHLLWSWHMLRSEKLREKWKHSNGISFTETWMLKYESGKIYLSNAGYAQMAEAAFLHWAHGSFVFIITSVQSVDTLFRIPRD